MSSTKKVRRADATCESVFAALLGAARELVKRKGPMFPAAFDAGAGTYYLPRAKTTMRPEDFELDPCESATELRKALTRMWREAGEAEFARLAEPLSRLAKKLRKAEEQAAEVSPTMYVMF